MKSFRWRLTAWFALSLLSVLGVFTGVTYFHLQHELRLERWEREKPGNEDWVLHGSYSSSEVDDIAGELGRLSLLYAIPVALLAVGLGYFLATRSMRPLADVNRQLGQISASRLSHRVRLSRVDEEFQAIESHINALLERLEGAFRQLTEYSAQVAHELRAPLTLLRLKVEDAAGKIDPTLAESLQEELARLSDYVDQCLLLATAEQGRLALVMDRVALRPLLVDLLETYELWARSQGRTVELAEGPDFTVTGDRRYLLQMFHALLSNAVRHGTGPVRVELRTETDRAVCRIVNSVRPTVRTCVGAGLGLRLARAIAATHNCRVTAGKDGDTFRAEIGWDRVDSAHAVR